MINLTTRWMQPALLLCTFMAFAQASAQTDVEFIELDLRNNAGGDSLLVYVRVTGPTDFAGSLNEIKYTIRWPSTGPTDVTIDPNGLTQFCQPGFNILYYQQVPQYPSTGAGVGYAYATMNAFGLPPISQACPDQVWPTGEWKLIQRLLIVNIGAGCTEFQIVNDGYTASTGRETYIELMGQGIDHAVEPTLAYIGAGGPCVPDCAGTPGGPDLPGTPCDDGDPDTYGDEWNANCECIGTWGAGCDADFQIVQTLFGNVLIPFTFSITNASFGEPVLSYAWDNIPSTAAEPSHTIPATGVDYVYSLCLDVTDGVGCTSTHCDTVYVDTNGIIHQEPPPCNSDFYVEQIAPFTAQFTNSSNGFGLTGATWSLPNGQTQTGDVITYSFADAGTYEICMTPIGYGCGVVCHTVQVSENGIVTAAPCEAGFWVIQAFEYGPTGDVIPIAFYLWAWNYSVGAGNIQYLWDFGDGNTSTDAYPLHVYAGSGPYDLCLTITDAGGCTDSYCHSLNVDNDGMLGMMLADGSNRNTLTVNVLPMIGLGMDDKPHFTELTAWPNPASDVLNISVGSTVTGNTTVTIFDMSGRVARIMDRSFQTGTDLLTIPVADLAPGLYTVRLDNRGSSTSLRFVKND